MKTVKLKTIKSYNVLFVSDLEQPSVSGLLQEAAFGIEHALYTDLPSGESFDLVLIETDADRSLEVFHRVQSSMGNLPIVMIVKDLDIARSSTIIEAGAQECLVSDTLDVRALERAVRFSIIRASVPTERESQLPEREGEFEKQLRQIQKMEAVGTLAGGVAHDMNNVLGSIMGLASVLQEDLGETDPRYRDAVDIVAACRKGRNLTRNLLGFARKGKYRKELVALNDIVREVEKILAHTVSKKVTIRIKTEPELAVVEGDPTQLNHAVMNICINSVDAMPSGGVLTISTSSTALSDRDVCSYPGMAAGPYIKLEIRDTGLGMDADTLEHAFEPFFTTKPKGRGTGLGLSMVYGTIKNHGGIINLASSPSDGTLVTIYMPKQGKQLVQNRQGINGKSSKFGIGSVLLVDDEEMVRISARRMLERFGYKVLTASHGKEALDRFKEEENITVVILDMIMPVMDGEATFKALRKKSPDLPILLSSGFSREDKAEKLLSLGHTTFIQKPFGLSSLAEALKQLV